jgi:hypothetical protein
MIPTPYLRAALAYIGRALGETDSQTIYDPITEQPRTSEPDPEADVAYARRLLGETVFFPIDRSDMDAISPCGHYMRFRLPCVHEDGSESIACMQCDRDAAQDRLDVACARLSRLGGFDLASIRALDRYDLDAASGSICAFSEGRFLSRAAVMALLNKPDAPPPHPQAITRPDATEQS